MKIKKEKLNNIISQVVEDLAKQVYETRCVFDKDSKLVIESKNKLHKETISSVHNIYTFYDPKSEIQKEFVTKLRKIWSGDSSSHQPDDQIRFISGENICAGSGYWEYEYKNKRLRVEGINNGNGYLGTDYYISEITSTSDVAGFDSPIITRKQKRKLQFDD